MATSTTGLPRRRDLPEDLLAFFTESLASYQLSNAGFRVLCSLTSASAAPNNQLAPVPPASPPRFLLVLDSSFNPPTLAHQRMALSAASDARYSDAASSRLLLLLATSNADKAPKPAAFPQRLVMMYAFARDLLSRDNGNVAAVDIAVTTEPYFHSKSKAIAESTFYRQPQQDPEPLSSSAGGSGSLDQVYLTGFDTLIRIFNPKYYPGGSMVAALDPLFARSRLRVTLRTGADWGDAAAQWEYLDGLRRGGLEEVGGRTAWAERVEMIEDRQDGEDPVVSSTKVRAAVIEQNWAALRLLVSERIAGWIRSEGLYAHDDR